MLSVGTGSCGKGGKKEEGFSRYGGVCKVCKGVHV